MHLRFACRINIRTLPSIPIPFVINIYLFVSFISDDDFSHVSFLVLWGMAFMLSHILEDNCLAFCVAKIKIMFLFVFLYGYNYKRKDKFGLSLNEMKTLS